MCRLAVLMFIGDIMSDIANSFKHTFLCDVSIDGWHVIR